VGIVAGLLLVGVAAWVLRGDVVVQASSLSRGPRGLLAARLYLEDGGAQVTLLDRPLGQAERGGALVTAFPWRAFPTRQDLQDLDQFVAGGGELVLGYSGELLSPAESTVFEHLGLSRVEARMPPPLHPLRWREYAREEWRLVAEPGLEQAPGTAAEPVVVSAMRRLPEAPTDARVLYRTPRGTPAVFEMSRRKGRVLVLPTEAFANARVSSPGNAALLEGVLHSLGDEWTFDEFHHGIVARGVAPDLRPRRVLDLYLVHVAFLYAVAVLALARRFGPAMGERAFLASSTGAFLRALGAHHRRLRHEVSAARLLLERARAFDPRVDLPGDLARLPVANGIDFLNLARAVGKAQTPGGKKP
jgi:hypothetical protein